MLLPGYRPRSVVRFSISGKSPSAGEVQTLFDGGYAAELLLADSVERDDFLPRFFSREEMDAGAGNSKAFRKEFDQSLIGPVFDRRRRKIKFPLPLRTEDKRILLGTRLYSQLNGH